MVFFFFSSRRRHTRWNCDWSSDVCSSDLRDGFFEEPATCVRVRQISREIERFAPGRGNRVAGNPWVWIPPVATHVCAGLRQRDSNGGTKAPAGTGNEGIFAGQLKGVEVHNFTFVPLVRG